MQRYHAMSVGITVLLLALIATETVSGHPQAVRSVHEYNDNFHVLPSVSNSPNYDPISQTTKSTSSDLPVTPFDIIAHEVIQIYLSREAKVGSQIESFLTSVNTGMVLFSHLLHGCYQFEGPTTAVTLQNITSTLDHLKITSDRITESLMDIAPWDHPPPRSTTTNLKFCNALVPPFKRVVGFLQGTHLWYSFLEELSSTLASYEVQIVARLQHHRKSKQLRDIASTGNVTEGNLRETLQVIYNEHKLVTLRHSIHSLVSSATHLRLKHLSGTLQESLASSSSFTCENEDDKVTLKGTNVFLSEVLTCFRPGAASIAVIATLRIFIDVDIHALSLNSGKTFDVILVSPTWVVVGARTIDLSGPPGTEEIGEPDGKPGLPGGNGGNFLGVFDKIFGPLKIVSHGGDGGPGQRGGTSKVPELECPQHIKNQCCVGISGTGVNYLYKGTDGGQGGFGGRPGLVNLFPLGAHVPDAVQKDQAEGREGPTGTIGPAKRTNFAPFQAIVCLRNGGNTESPAHPIQEPPAQKLHRDQIASILLDFKSSARLVLNAFSKPHLRNFVAAITNHPDLASFQTPLDLLKEFHALESQFPVLKEDPDLENYYDSISLRAHNRAIKIPSSNSTTSRAEQQALLLLSAAALGRKLSLTTTDLEPILVINMHDFLKAELKKLSKLQHFSQIQKITAEYNHYVDNKLDQVHVLVHSIILPEIDAIEQKLNQQIGIILETIKQLRQRAAENVEALKKYRKQLKKYQMFSLLFAGLKLAGSVVSFFVPMAGQIINQGLDFAATQFGAHSQHPGAPPTASVALPASVVQGQQFAALRFNRDNGEVLRNFLAQINAVEFVLRKEAGAFEEPIRQIKELRHLTDSKIAEIPTSGDPAADDGDQDRVHPFLELLSSEEFVKNSADVLDKAIEKAQAVASHVNLTIPEGVVKHVGDIAKKLISAGSQISKKVLQDRSNLKEISRLIGQAEGDVRRLAQQQSRVEKSLVGEVNEMLSFVRRSASELSDKSTEVLEVIKWRLQSVLRDAKLEFRKEFTEGTGIEEYLSRSLEKLEEAYTTLIRLYEHVDSFRDQRALAQFYVTASSTNDISSSSAAVQIQDDKLRDSVMELQNLIRANVILEREKIVTASYRLWLFPFGNGPACRLESATINSTASRTPEGLESLLAQVGESFNKMLDRVNDARNTIRYGDKNIIKTEFKPQYPHVPYFTWANSTFSRSISSLLDGRTVILAAKPEFSPAQCDAIKFQTVAPMFTSSDGDSGVDATIQDALREYAVTMRYLGNSHYRLGDSTYVLPSNTVELHFSFKRERDGSPSVKNEVYTKLESGDSMLSPFTLWEMKLEPIGSHVAATPLVSFKNRVDLNLVGTGMCLRRDVGVRRSHILSDCEKV